MIYFIMGAAPLLIIATAIACTTATTVSLQWIDAAATSKAASTYLSVNIDSGSLANNLSFVDPALRELTRNLVRAAPTQLRIGGGAADNLAFTGPRGARGHCGGVMPGIDVCVDAAYVDEIMDFVAATGVELVWDLNCASRDVANAWNATNSIALLDHIAASDNKNGLPTAWQLGNEVEDWYKHSPPNNLTGAALARDYAALRVLLAERSMLSQIVYGPDACCEERRPILEDFARAAASASPPLVAAVTVHAYPIPRAANDSCLIAAYTSKAAMETLRPGLISYAAAVSPLRAVGVPIVLGETATSAHGGCDGLSNAFVAGFTFIYELGIVGEAGFSQLNRQDLVGCGEDYRLERWLAVSHARFL